jgi:hypothetical protein
MPTSPYSGIKFVPPLRDHVQRVLTAYFIMDPDNQQPYGLLYDPLSSHGSRFWTHSLIIPPYSVAVSLVFLLVHLLLSLLSKNPAPMQLQNVGETEHSKVERRKNSGFVFNLARAIGSISLMGLTIVSSLYPKPDDHDAWNGDLEIVISRMPVLSEADWLNVGMCLTLESPSHFIWHRDL